MGSTVLRSDENRRAWMGLAWFESFGSKTLRKIWKIFDRDGERAWRINRKRLLGLGVKEKTADIFLAWRKRIDLDACVRRCQAEGIRFILPDDDEYPRLLAEISDPPFGLFCRGADIACAFPIAVVGTRASTAYGVRATREIVGPLARAGADIVSGLALGIDGAAHMAALDEGSKTIAVLAGGINDSGIYPRQHATLAKRILDHGGAIVSEFPPGTEHRKFHFPLRNRIIAGLARAVVVVEATEKSGSLITARLALDENRDVFAVPGPITSAVSAGGNRLLKFGAIACTDADDILKHFEIAQGSVSRMGKRDPPAHIDLTEGEAETLALLDRPLHADDIVRTIGLPSAEINTILTNLELYGLIAEEEPNVYSRRKN